MVTPDCFIAPDIIRCQGTNLVTRHIPARLRLEPVAKWQRCKSKPLYIASEIEPGPDGEKGSMSVCWECSQKLIQTYGPSYARLETISKADYEKARDDALKIEIQKQHELLNKSSKNYEH